MSQLLCSGYVDILPAVARDPAVANLCGNDRSAEEEA